MADRVDKAGLTYFYNKIKSKFQNKLVAGSNVSISGDTISATDTTYSNATSSAAGLMSAMDKSKLDGVSGNWLDGSATGSVRTVGSNSDDSYYTIGQDAVAEGQGTQASGLASHSEGSATFASGDSAHAEGWYTEASGNMSHAEGSETNAIGNNSHAEGDNTGASGYASHTEGGTTVASGDYSHAEGLNTAASGANSHAEGYHTTASGDNTHVAGYYTTAQRRSQTVIGEDNIVDTAGSDGTERGDYVFIIGNGENGVSSNALTVDWNGNVNISAGASYKIDGVPLPNITISTSEPTAQDGNNGDIWIVYEA